MKAIRSSVSGLAKAVAFILVPGSAIAGGSVCAVVDPVWQAGHSRAQTALIASVDAMAAAVAAQSQITTEQLISAFKVATRQRSSSGGREAAYGKSTAMAVAQVYAEQTAAERIVEAHRTYGPAGQAVGSCDIIERLQATDIAMNTLSARAAEIARSGALYSAPGSAVRPGEAIAVALRYDVAEAVSAEAFMDPETSGALKDAFMNNVIGLPPVKPLTMGSPADRMTMMLARRVEAIRSPAIVSISAVRAANEEGGGFGHGDGATAMSQLDWLISRYGGGREYEEWSAALVTKSEVGLIKEMARLNAVGLLLENFMSGSNDRREAMIAALLAAEAVQ